MIDQSEYIGQTFGKLLITEITRERNSKGTLEIFFVCSCSCGNIHKARKYEVLRGDTSSCGCAKVESIIRISKKHGMHDTPEYRAWCGMKSRTTLVNDSNTSGNYAKRSIIVEEPWFSSFEQFYKDMGPRPSDKHPVERKDVNGNYCKENCIWGTPAQQAFNIRKKKNNKSGRTGVYKGNDGKYQVYISFAGQFKYLMSTEDFELACFCREEAELTYYGFIKE